MDALYRDLNAARQYRPHIENAADHYTLPVSVLLGIGSRESRWGLALRPPGPAGTGDFIRRNGSLAPDGRGWGRGLMQIDYQAHAFAREGKWQDAEANIFYGAKVLHRSQKFVERRADVPPLEMWTLILAGHHAAISAYNTGPGNVLRSLRTGRSVDATTHGGDYSKDVIRRADWFGRHCTWAQDGIYELEEAEALDPVASLNSNISILESQIKSMIDEYNIIESHPS